MFRLKQHGRDVVLAFAAPPPPAGPDSRLVRTPSGRDVALEDVVAQEGPFSPRRPRDGVKG
jgi:hypothetical protein